MTKLDGLKGLAKILALRIEQDHKGRGQWSRETARFIMEQTAGYLGGGAALMLSARLEVAFKQGKCIESAALETLTSVAVIKGIDLYQVIG